MIVLTQEAVVIIAQSKLEGIRGIAASENWHNSRPITLAMLVEEAIVNHPEIIWLGEDPPEESFITKNIIQPINPSVIEAPKMVTDPPEAITEKPAAVTDPPEAATDPEAATGEGWTEYEGPTTEGDEKQKSPKDLGKWEEYQAKALSNDEINFVIKGMRDEGYTYAMISTVVRLTAPSIKYRLSKMHSEE